MSNLFILDRSHIDYVERNISPPMAYSVTIPVLDKNGASTGIAVYIAISPFAGSISRKTLELIASSITLNLETNSDICADCGQPREEHDIGGGGHRFRYPSYPVLINREKED